MRIELNFKNNELDGLFTEWFPNGPIMEKSNFAKNQKDGESIVWYILGQMKSKKVFAISNIEQLIKSLK